MGKIGIYTYEDGTADVQIQAEELFFEFGAKTLEEAARIINSLKNSKVAINPSQDFWSK